ncbi:hypothetical protein ABGB07_02265 [Micromonosporaceae bacterium B7E4]
MTKLPAEGRKGPAPKWPLIPDVVMSARRDLAAAAVERHEYDLEEAKDADRPTGGIERKLDTAREKLEILNRQLAEQKKLEASLWRDLWKLPQAVQWGRLGWTRDVAQYVRHKVLAELGDLDSAREARQWSDRLGLSPMAMLRLRWAVVENEVAQKREEKQAAAPSARRRLKVVDPGAVAG